MKKKCRSHFGSSFSTFRECFLLTLPQPPLVRNGPADEGEGDEGYDQERHRRCHRQRVRDEEEDCHDDARVLGQRGLHTGYECGEVHHPGPVHAQDQEEARHKSGKEGGLREGHDGQGEAGEDDRQGVLRGGLEEIRLRSYCANLGPALSWVACGTGASCWTAALATMQRGAAADCRVSHPVASAALGGK